MGGLVAVNLALLWSLVLLELVLLIGLARRMRTLSPLPQSLPTLEAGQPAPEFSVRTPQGELRTLEGFAGQALAIVFLSPYCPSCRRVPADLRRLRPSIEAAGAHLAVACDARTTDPEAQEFLNDLARDLDVLLAPRGQSSMFSDYLVLATPSFALLDAEGRIRAGGPLDGSNLAHAIATASRGDRSTPGAAKEAAMD